MIQTNVVKNKNRSRGIYLRNSISIQLLEFLLEDKDPKIITNLRHQSIGKATPQSQNLSSNNFNNSVARLPDTENNLHLIKNVNICYVVDSSQKKEATISPIFQRSI